ncbi:MAG: metal-dependent transcriptional regulator [Dehalococcoidia bacterium]
MIDERSQQYLKTIGQMEEEGEEATTSSLARSLNVSMPSVTEMLQRLAAKGLVDHKRRGQVRLTKEGQRLASSLIRRHRLWEAFLVRFLGFSWDEVHEEACRLEHATSDPLEERLASFLRDLDTCPHGHNIPHAAAPTRAEPAVPLTKFSGPGPARVVRIQDETAQFLRELTRLDISPGRVLQTEGVRSADGSVRVRLDGRSEQVPAEMAEQIMVQPAQPEDTTSDRPVPVSELRPDQVGIIVDFSGLEESPWHQRQHHRHSGRGGKGFLDHFGRRGRNFLARCLALGLSPGTEVKVVHNSGHGPLILSVRGTRVALGRGEAERLRVKRANDA